MICKKVKSQYLLFIIMLTSAFSGYCQSNYIPLKLNDAHYLYECTTTLDICKSTSSHKYIGDTIINSYTYNVIKSEYYRYPACSALVDFVMPISYIRDDSVNRKVYYYDVSNLKDTIMYDFSLQIGDTFRSPFFNETILFSIDSMQINTIWHKVYLFKKEYTGGITMSFPIIEGIGGSLGFFKSIIFFPEPSLTYGGIVCYSVGNEIKYPYNVIGKSCAWPAFTNDLETEEGSLYFANNNLKINSDDGELLIYNIQGQIVYNKSSLKVNDINLSYLPTGIYVVKYNSKGRNEILKIFKQ